jgi:putative oxidoreductase
MNTILHPLARFLVALIFLASGLGKAFGFAAAAEMMEKMGFPVASLSLASAIAVEILGGLALLFGYKTRLAAGLLIAFLIPTTLIFHVAALGSGDAARFQMELMQAFKNLAIIGGLIKFWIDGAGAFALDNWQSAPLAKTQTV